VWGRFNTVPLAERCMRPLPADVALNHQELAEQPLLLLMLALYDADANALQSRSAGLGRTELYGRLLKEFALREVRKHSSGIREMGRPSGLRAQLTAAQLAVGRFFFVHESQATRDDMRLQTYEFLHATFGEFLVARLVTQVLTDMLARETAAARSLLGPGDDGLLHALLSFAALASSVVCRPRPYGLRRQGHTSGLCGNEVCAAEQLSGHAAGGDVLVEAVVGQRILSNSERRHEWHMADSTRNVMRTDPVTRAPVTMKCTGV